MRNCLETETEACLSVNAAPCGHLRSCPWALIDILPAVQRNTKYAARELILKVLVSCSVYPAVYGQLVLKAGVQGTFLEKAASGVSDIITDGLMDGTRVRTAGKFQVGSDPVSSPVSGLTRRIKTNRTMSEWQRRHIFRTVDITQQFPGPPGCHKDVAVGAVSIFTHACTLTEGTASEEFLLYRANRVPAVLFVKSVLRNAQCGVRPDSPRPSPDESPRGEGCGCLARAVEHCLQTAGMWDVWSGGQEAREGMPAMSMFV
ncbi:unnamed protein product [Boreogadus saida]